MRRERQGLCSIARIKAILLLDLLLLPKDEPSSFSVFPMLDVVILPKFPKYKLTFPLLKI
jgi:hypothetical protein